MFLCLQETVYQFCKVTAILTNWEKWVVLFVCDFKYFFYFLLVHVYAILGQFLFEFTPLLLT